MPARSVTIRYFASLREAAGASSEVVESSAELLKGLYDEIRVRHRFRLSSEDVKASVNGDWAEMNSRFKPGDEIVFLPPVAGG